MFETYRMLGREREAELLREAQRLSALAGRRRGPSLDTTLLAVAIVVIAALLLWTGTASAST